VPWLIEPLNKGHRVQDFSCGEAPLDAYLKKNALQSSAAGLGRTFVALEPGNEEVCGYFTMAAGSVRFDTIPEHIKHRLPKYPIPTAHLAKLAVHQAHQKKGLGVALLIEALRRSASAGEHIGVFAVDVIALNDNARSFYLKYGFLSLLDNELHLYMHIKTAKKLAAIVDGGGNLI
jgi:ribosomal protein S18 acetylase RimI-like enzyme